MNLRAGLCVLSGSVVLATASALVAAPSVVPAYRATPAAEPAPLPQRLHDTGLYVPGTNVVRDGNLPFSPQYALWSDGARKRRWIHLPPGTSIDAADANAWKFPAGTRLWKEFGYGRPVETRMIERLPDGSWRFASYAWNEAGTEALLVPDDGAVVPAANAPHGRHAIPSRSDCLACHEGAPVPVLGFSALQLSADRDPLAPHAEATTPAHVDLPRLVARGLVRNLPRELVDSPPRIAAQSPTARAALGYLHANCGHCHNAAGALQGLEFALAQRVDAGDAAAALVGQASRYRPHGASSARRVVAGDTDASVVTLRMKTDNPFARMPPLGVQVVDAEGIALVERWIKDLRPPEPTS
jgi:hypothetical protein